MKVLPLPPPAELADLTYKWEKLRSVLVGMVEVIWQPGASVALLIAIRYFEADDFSKGIVSASNFIGFLIAPLSLSLFARFGRPITWNMAGLYAGTALLLFCAAFTTHLPIYVFLMAIAHITLMQHLPMNTEMYGTHFTTDLRGRRMSTVFLIAGSISAAAGLLTGYILDLNLNGFRGLFILSACAALGAAFCLLQIPSRPLDPKKVGNWVHNLGLVKRDRLFAWMLFSWMLMGFGNLMTLPLRIEYMANPVFGINASNKVILLVTGVIPLIARLIMTRFLGRLFDRVNVVLLRIGLNLLFLISMLLFFSTSHVWVMAVAMALLGGGMAGGKLLWTLWVTKLAPPDLSSAYMSIHMLSTGLRGSIAPFIGYGLIQIMAILQVAWLGAGMVLVSTLLFIPAKRHMDRRTLELSSS